MCILALHSHRLHTIDYECGSESLQHICTLHHLIIHYLVQKLFYLVQLYHCTMLPYAYVHRNLLSVGMRVCVYVFVDTFPFRECSTIRF